MKTIPIDHLVLSGFIGNSFLLIFVEPPLTAVTNSGNIARQTLTDPANTALTDMFMLLIEGEVKNDNFIDSNGNKL